MEVNRLILSSLNKLVNLVEPLKSQSSERCLRRNRLLDAIPVIFLNLIQPFMTNRIEKDFSPGKRQTLMISFNLWKTTSSLWKTFEVPVENLWKACGMLWENLHER